MQYARQTATPCTLAEIKDGSWVQNDGMSPSGVKTSRAFLSRVSVLGVIIEKDNSSLVLEDGTNSMQVRSFDTKPVPVYGQVGDIVLVIGRPREYNGERYLVLEICKKIKNAAWIQYRKRELEQLGVGVIETVPHEESAQVVQVANPFELIVAAVRALDSGAGANIDDVLSRVQHPETQQFLRTLIEEGEIFEIRPGKLKVLE